MAKLSVLSVLGSAKSSAERQHMVARAGASEGGRVGGGGGTALSSGAVLTGPEFRERVLRADGSINRDNFMQLWPGLRVMGRCSPQDKHTIVRGAHAPCQKSPFYYLHPACWQGNCWSDDCYTPDFSFTKYAIRTVSARPCLCMLASVSHLP